MKKIILCLVAVAIVFTTTNAQDTKGPVQNSPEHRADRYLTNLNEQYGLTDAQKPKLKEILIKRETSRDELRKKYAGDNASFGAEFKKANTEADAAIKALLTPEQVEHQKKYVEAIRQKNKENAEKRSKATAPQSTTPAPTTPATPEKK